MFELWTIEECKQIRKLLGISCEKVANIIGVTKQTISNYENGKAEYGKKDYILYTYALRVIMEKEGYFDTIKEFEKIFAKITTP